MRGGSTSLMYRLSYQFGILSSFPLSERREGSAQILDFVLPLAGLCFPRCLALLCVLQTIALGLLISCKERLGYLARAENGDSGHTLDVIIKDGAKKEGGDW